MRSYYPLLDILRFASALGVAFFHLMFWSWAGIFSGIGQTKQIFKGAAQFPFAIDFTWFGWVGVDVFFVISGFVIANSASNTSASEFLLGRVLRLYPAVWVCSTATFIVLLLFASGSASEFIVPYLRAMLLIPKGLNGQWLDCVYWTLSAEMAFYGLVSCALLTKRVTLRHLAWGLTIYSGVFNALALLVVSQMTPSDIPYLVILMFRVPCATWLLSHGCFFALGIWLFISANRKLTAFELFAVAVTCLSGAAEIYCFSDFLLKSIPAISEESPLVPILVWAAAVLIIALAANRSRHSTGTAHDAAGSSKANYLRTMGLITYPLYLTHDIVGSAIIRVLVDAGLDDTLAVVVALGMLVLLCWLICAKIEPAIRDLCRHALANLGLLPKTAPIAGLRKPSSTSILSASPVPASPSPGLRLPLPARGEASFAGR